MDKRRVVVTGLGLVTPLGHNVNISWSNILAGKSGIGKITHFDTSDSKTTIAGEVKHGEGAFNIEDFAGDYSKDIKKAGRFIRYGFAAAVEAITDSGIKFETEEEKNNSGVIIGSGIGGLDNIEDSVNLCGEKGPSRVSPFFIPSCLINLISGHVAIKYGINGPNHSVVTACSTGGHAISDAARIIQVGEANVMIAGGAEAAICKIGIAGFNAARALSTRNDSPEEASRPWDKDRDGFVMGEGAGVMVLEEYEHAKKRGAKIYAEIIGWGLSGDAYHVTAPESTGYGARLAMKKALAKANFNVDQIDYINAHGTSTPLGDAIEIGAIKNVFGNHSYNLIVSSTKSSIGHLLGAAGGVEAIFSVLSIRDSVIAPTLNLHNPSEGCDLNFSALKATERKVGTALSNSFGFGGTNISLIFRKFS